MYVLTFDKDVGTTDSSLNRFVKRISAVGRRVSDAGVVNTVPLNAATSAVKSEAERLIFCLSENG